MPSIRPLFSGLVALVLLCASAPALAIDTVCVQTLPDLLSALNAAQAVPKRIKVSQGAYNIDSTTNEFEAFYILAAGSSIEGGYFSGCGNRSIAVGNTIFSATERVRIEVLGSVTIEGITFELADGLQMSPQTYADPGLDVVFRRDAFRNSGSTFRVLDLDWFMDEADLGGSVKIVDSLFVNNTTSIEDCVIEISNGNGTSSFVLVNNTVINNNAGGVCMRNYPDTSYPGNASLFAYNNIIWNNAGGDIYTDTANLELKWNTYATFTGPTPTTEAFTQHGDPKLDVNYHPIESPASPVINTGAFDGNPDLTIHDLDGGPRVVGTRVDRGAYESSLDDAYLLKVKNTNDSGVDSLRAAIAGANANGGGLISFEIPGDCTPAHVITLASQLPAIAAPVIISGFTQNGATPNGLDIGNDADICVVLEGSNSIGNGLIVNPNPPANTQLTVLGLGFSGFVDAAINLSGGSGHGLQGNHIGGKANGITLAPSGYGVYVAEGVSNVAIGGVDTGSRNIIGDATLDGIHLHGPVNATPAASGNTITNNYVGVGWASAAFVNHGNGKKGIHVLGPGNHLTGNIVGFNTSDGIDLDGTSASGNVIESNLIGVAYAADGASTAMANAVGVRLENAPHDNKIRYNTIAYSLGPGVRVVSGLGNTIRFNDIGVNGALGIDLADLGVTANDNDGDLFGQGRANRALNFPLITLATGVEGANALANGLLTSTPGDYFIDVYLDAACDSTGYGEGQLWLGSSKITIGQGETFAPFTVSIGRLGLPPGLPVTATATDAAANASPGNTSEFSACKTMTDDRIFAGRFDPPI